jgi:hypothetical protein
MVLLAEDRGAAAEAAPEEAAEVVGLVSADCGFLLGGLVADETGRADDACSWSPREAAAI